MQSQSGGRQSGWDYAKLVAPLWARSVTGGIVTAMLLVAAVVVSTVTLAERLTVTWPAISLNSVTLFWALVSIPIATFELWKLDRRSHAEALGKANGETALYKELVDRINEPDFRDSCITEARLIEHDCHLGFLARLVIINLGANARIVRWSVRAEANGIAVAGNVSQIPTEICRSVLGTTRFIHDLAVNIGLSPFCRRHSYRGELWAEFDSLEIDANSLVIEMRDENGRLYRLAPDPVGTRLLEDQRNSAEPFPTDIPQRPAKANDG
jgi:hypothetical protein